jgi:hypothetical protein
VNTQIHDQPAAPVESKRARRVRTRAAKYADEGDALVAWTQAWVSRDGRLHLFAARTYDYVVVTERELMLISTGFFSRRPRRLVYAAQLAVLKVLDGGRGQGRELIVYRPRQRPLRLQMHGGRHDVAVWGLLQQRTRRSDDGEPR